MHKVGPLATKCSTQQAACCLFARRAQHSTDARSEHYQGKGKGKGHLATFDLSLFRSCAAGLWVGLGCTGRTEAAVDEKGKREDDNNKKRTLLDLCVREFDKPYLNRRDTCRSPPTWRCLKQLRLACSCLKSVSRGAAPALTRLAICRA